MTWAWPGGADGSDGSDGAACAGGAGDPPHLHHHRPDTWNPPSSPDLWAADL